MTNGHFLTQAFLNAFQTSFYKRFSQNDKSMLEEAVSFAYTKLLEKRINFDFNNEGALYNWLFLTARRKLSRQIKRAKKFSPLKGLSYAQAESMDIARIENSDFFERMLPEISEKNREVLRLSLSGMDKNEIAAALDETPDTIKHRYQRGIADIRKKEKSF